MKPAIPYIDSAWNFEVDLNPVYAVYTRKGVAADALKSHGLVHSLNHWFVLSMFNRFASL